MVNDNNNNGQFIFTNPSRESSVGQSSDSGTGASVDWDRENRRNRKKRGYIKKKNGFHI